jgi:hypothetical protein
MKCFVNTQIDVIREYGEKELFLHKPIQIVINDHKYI